MALPHAQPLDVIRVRPLGADLRKAVSTSLLKTDRLQLLHLVLPAHKDMPEHRVEEPCTIQCLEGDVEVVMPGQTRRLRAGDLVVMPGGQAHALRADADSAVLLTLLLQGGDAGSRSQGARRRDTAGGPGLAEDAGEGGNGGEGGGSGD